MFTQYNQAVPTQHKSKKKSKEEEAQRYANERATIEKEAEANRGTRLNENVAQKQKEREAGYAKGRARAQELFNTPTIGGLDPETRKIMQAEAHNQIKRARQGASRRLLGEQSQRGIVGRGGVGYAQQRDLERMAGEAEGQATRDLHKLDADQRLKNIAATLNLEQGEAGQMQLDQQVALDELKYEEEKKRARSFEEQLSKYFSRI